MGVMPLIIVCSLLVAMTFLMLFIRVTRQGQYDDVTTPAVRMTFDDEPLQALDSRSNNEFS